MDKDDSILFDANLIDSLDWSKVQNGLPGLDGSFKIRPLRVDDYDRGFTKVLSQLTDVGDVSREEYEERFKLMRDSKLVKIVVIEDIDCNKIAGTATLLCEPKFTHHCSWIGHIQDVVVDEDYRGKRLGKRLVACLKLLAMNIGAYKVDLDCSDNKITFYTSLGFVQEPGRANYLACRFKS